VGENRRAKMREKTETGTVIPAEPGWAIAVYAAEAGTIWYEPIIAWGIRVINWKDNKEEPSYWVDPITSELTQPVEYGMTGFRRPDGTLDFGDWTGLHQTEEEALGALKAYTKKDTAA
jgi:hypothetical protein